MTVSLPTKLLIVAALMAVSALAAGRLGYQLAEGQAAKAELDLQSQIDAQRQAGQRRNDRLAVDLETERTTRKQRDRIINKGVQSYVQIVPADRRCVLDGRWVLLHDAAASGEPADAASLAAGAAESVTDATALDTIAGNYEQCREWRAQLIGWQRYWSEVVTPTE